MERVRRALRRVFFGVADAHSLNLFRFLYCLTLAYTLGTLPSVGTLAVLERYPETFRPIQLFALLGIERVSPFAFSAIHHALLAALICAALGLLTRAALTASGAGFFLYHGTALSAFKPPTIDVVGHNTENVIWVLLILAVSPRVGLWGVGGWLRRAGRWSLDGDEAQALTPAWPLQTVKLLLAVIYFGAAYSKLNATLLWPDGLALQSILLEKVMQQDGLNCGLWLAHSRFLCALVSVACLLVEGSFALALFYPGLGPLFALAGIGMHAGMWALLGLNYFRYFAAIYWVFLSWPELLRLAGFLPGPRVGLPGLRQESARFAAAFARAREDFAPGRGTVYAAAFVAAFFAVHMYCIFAKFRAWPLSHWRFYPDRGHYSEAVAYRFQGVGRGGEARWLSPGELLQGTVPVNNNMEAALYRGDRRWLQDKFKVIGGELRRRGAGYESLVLVERTVRRSADGRFEIVDSPIIRAPLGDSEALSIVGSFRRARPRAR